MILTHIVAHINQHCIPSPTIHWLFPHSEENDLFLYGNSFENIVGSLCNMSNERWVSDWQLVLIKKITILSGHHQNRAASYRMDSYTPQCDDACQNQQVTSGPPELEMERI